MVFLLGLVYFIFYLYGISVTFPKLEKRPILFTNVKFEMRPRGFRESRTLLYFTCLINFGIVYIYLYV